MDDVVCHAYEATCSFHLLVKLSFVLMQARGALPSVQVQVC